MKKELNQIIIVLGFLVAVVGAILTSLFNVDAMLSTIIASNISIILAATFIFANNSIVKNVGYCLAATAGADGLTLLFTPSFNIGYLISGIGRIIMLVGALLYFILICLKFFGFVKCNNHSVNTKTQDSLDILNSYKELVNEKIVSEEEFEQLKKNILSSADNKVKTLDDLKKWKKALDQKVISEEEYSNIKSEIFKK